MKRFFCCLLVLCCASGFFCGRLAAADTNAGQNHIVFINVTEYNSKIADLVEDLFTKLMKPGDALTLFTPVRPYSFTPETFKKQPLKAILKRVKDVLKKDCTLASANYRQVLDAMNQTVLDLSGANSSEGSGGFSSSGGDATRTHKTLLIQYRQILESMRKLRRIGEGLFLKLASMIKGRGKATIYMFYEKRIRIIPDRRAMETLRKNPDLAFDANELFFKAEMKGFMDTKKVSVAFKDAGVTFHFVYIQRDMRKRRGTQHGEFSSDVYHAFSKLAEDTGGIVEATSKPVGALKKILEKK
jgi:hypothetical protein